MICPASRRLNIEPVVSQHAEEAAFLWLQRSRLAHAPHVALRHFARIDERVAAHVDGLRVAGEFGWELLQAQLATGGAGELFAAAVMALEGKDAERIDRLFALAEAVPTVQRGLRGAFGWISAPFLQGTIKELLASPSPFRRYAAIACCAMHRVDPGKSLDASLRDADSLLRSRPLRSAAELGRVDLLPECERAMQDDDAACRFWAAWGGALLGDRRNAVDSLLAFARELGMFHGRALRLALKVMTVEDAHAFLESLAPNPKNLRWLIQGSGIVGDPYYVPWLIKQMGDMKLTRLAGESFSYITGLDLARLDLEAKPPENFEPGPNDDPDDPDVSMDPDDSLPWPDSEKIANWWDSNKSGFTSGVRYFMGKPVTREHCIQVLKEGYQRQRIAAAEYLCLLEPGAKLFPTSAPAWRQQRWLSKMN